MIERAKLQAHKRRSASHIASLKPRFVMSKGDYQRASGSRNFGVGASPGQVALPVSWVREPLLWQILGTAQ